MKFRYFSPIFLLCSLLTGSLQAADAPVAGSVPGTLEPVAPVMPAVPTVSLFLNGRMVQFEVENLDNPLVVISTTRGDMLLELFPAEAPLAVANFLGLAAGTKPFTDPFTAQETLRPFYDGLIFHRVIPGFMIQGGSPTGLGDGTPGYSFRDEINALSLGLDKMQVLDAEGYPNAVLGIQSQDDFQDRVLTPLYEVMGIDSQESLEARMAQVEERLRNMSVKQNLELQGYRYIETVQSHAPVRGVIAMANSGPDTNGSQFFITLADTDWLTGKHTVFGKIRAGLEVLDAISKVRVGADNRPVQDVTILNVREIPQ